MPFIGNKGLYNYLYTNVYWHNLKLENLAKNGKKFRRKALNWGLAK